MQLGSFTVPPLALAAVLGAGVLVILVLWGVWRARRTPAPEPLPVAPPETVGAPPPCAEDWTGESAGGPADPPRPARPRTVADAVAERGADTGPIPGLPIRTAPAASATGTVGAASAAGRHAAPDGAGPITVPSDERPDGATLARTGAPAATRRRPRPSPAPRGGSAAPAVRDEEATGPAADGTADGVAGSSTVESTPGRGVAAVTGAVAAGAVGAGLAAAAPDPGGAATDSGTTTPDPGTAAPDPRTAATGSDAAAPDPDDPAQDPGDTPGAAAATTRPAARFRIVDAADAVEAGTDTDTDAAAEADDTAAPTAWDRPRTEDPTVADDVSTGPLPPWSAERTVPAVEDLPCGDRGSADATADRAAADEAPDGVPAAAAAGAPEPMSRAVQQALAARAVQRARILRAEIDDAEPETGGQQELPLSVVPSTQAVPAAGVDARDRLLGVLLADPARALDATRTLDDSRDRIEQLGDVLRRRREELAGAVRHLHECGLDPVQIGRLSGLATADVRTILDGEDAGRG